MTDKPTLAALLNAHTPWARSVLAELRLWMACSCGWNTIGNESGTWVAHAVDVAGVRMGEGGLDVERSRKKIGVLCHDNGEYDAYVAYFDDPDKLWAAVRRLNAERLDTDAMEPVAAEVHVETVHVVPDTIDDNFLDLLARMLEDVGIEVESANDRQQRLAEEAAEKAVEEEIPFVPSPGQVALEGDDASPL